MSDWSVHRNEASPAGPVADTDLVRHLARLGALEAAERVMDRLDAGEDVGEALSPVEVERHLSMMGFRDGFVVPSDARAFMEQRRG